MRWLCSGLAVTLLFMQLATAAYACPATIGAAPAAVEMAEMPGCDGNMPGTMDPNQPLLCQAHCQQGSQAAHASPALDTPSTPVLLAVLDWSLAKGLPAALSTRCLPVLSAGAAPPGSPPLYLRLLVLRN
jgi:hypothetical protein